MTAQAFPLEIPMSDVKVRAREQAATNGPAPSKHHRSDEEQEMSETRDTRVAGESSSHHTPKMGAIDLQSKSPLALALEAAAARRRAARPSTLAMEG